MPKNSMLKTLWQRWLVVAKTIGRFQSQLVLAVVYFTAIAPFAVAIRLFTNPLNLRGAPSWHWLPRRTEPATLNSVRQQF